MTPPEPKACTACAFHVRKGMRHLCLYVARTVDHRGVARVATAEVTLDFKVEGTAFGGTVSFSDDELSCDRWRRMGGHCGPAGTLWEPRQA
ncbi:MAG: hypothetical protein ACTHJ9_05325 [Rhodanobacter sp.]